MEWRKPMVARTTAFCVVLVAGCASTSRTVQDETLTSSARSPGLFMGHSVDGDVVIAATHYSAMGGLATTAEELGLPARKGTNSEMLSHGELLTGPHVPRWICRYADDVRETRRQTAEWLDQPRI